jgi:hypothetical protein
LKDVRELDENTIAFIREEIVSAKYKYESKIKDLLEVNARYHFPITLELSTS